MSFHRNDKLDFRQPHNQFDGIKKTNCDNNSQKRRDHNSNHKQRQPNDGKNDDEEERTRRRIEQRRQSGKGTTGNLTSTNNQRTKNSEEEKEVAKSERILNSLIEEVRHRKEGALTSARLNVQKENAEESEGDGSRTTKQKKHKKKKRQKEKEHKSKKKSHQSSKSRDYSEDETERHTKKKKKHHQSEGGEEEEEWTKSVRGLRVEVDETKGSRVVTASDGDEMSFCADFQLFGYEKAKDDSRAAISKSMARKQQNFDNSGSDSDEDGAGNSDDQSDESLSQKKQPTLANILASAPVTFPWLTALGNTKQSEDADGEKAEQSEKKVEQKREEQKKETDQKTDHNINKKESKEGTTAKSLKKKSRHRRRSSERSSSKQRKHVKRKASRSRSRTYSTSPERIISHEKGRHRHNRPSTSKSPTPLPPFSKQRAFETRRKLIEESWHRRIEQSVRPCEVIAKKSVTDSNGPGESEYTDKNGRIDKQKLLEIATRNATRLAMEGKLPKGAELVETIKNKSVGQLVDLCSKLQSDPSLKLKRHGDASSNSESDEEKRYSHEYDKWQQKEQRREDREFRNRAVRPAGESAPLSRREQKEIVQREENTLRLTFPVSSGVQHRVKANAPAPAETPAGPLVRFGDIGPLTTALAKVRTNIPAAYKPLSKPLPLALPTSTLSTNFQSTSQVQLGPQLPSPDCQPNKPFCSDFVPAKKLDCVNQNVYEIALAASARKEEAESRDKTSQTVPLTATSAQFIGPMVPNPAIDSVQTASRLLNTDSESTDPKPSSTIKETLSSKSVFSSSWDRPGHIAAREAFLKKIAEQKRKAEQEKSDGKGTDGSETQKMEQKQTAKEMPMGDGAQLQKNPNASLPTIVVPQLDMAPSSSSSPHVCATTTTTTFSHSESVSMSVPSPHQKQVSTNGTTGTSSTTTAPTNENRTNDVEQFKKPALPPVSKQTFVASHAGTSMLLPADTKQQVEVPQRRTNDEKSSESTKAMEGQGNNFLDRFHFFVEAQVARQKAESALQATILSTAVQQKPIAAFREEVPTFSSSSSSFSSRPVFAMAPLPFSRSETQGLTKPQKSIQELVAERLRYTHRLQRDPNDYEARKALARVDKEMSLWAQDSSLPGEFTGNTGARVLSEKELEPSDPRFHAWAKKDQFRTAPEINSGIGMKLLQRMGWQPGQGLGRDRAGQLEPLTLDVKADRKGLFSSFERAPTRESVLDSAGKNPVSVLMEQCARHHWHNPEFSCVESGPQNNRRYLWKAVLNGVEYTPSLPSSNKKAAKAQVCMVILEALGLTTN